MAKSVAKNAVYNGIRTVCNMLFPLITYPYAARVLMAENLGKVDFVTSVISYFVLVAGLGIATYATREGAARRNDQDELNQFSSEVFTINMVSTLISYALLAILLLAWPRLQGYMQLVALQSLMIVGTTIGVEWVYSVQEDYGYITLRSIVVQVISAALLFCLVKDSSDYVIYAGILVFSNVGANVFNFIRARRYVRIRFVWHFDVMSHLVPMLVLFGNAVAVTIYVNIDITLLNVYRGDYEVGIYSLAVKVYTILKSLLNSVTNVALPRLSLYRANDRQEEYQSLQDAISHALIVVVLPVVALFILMADYVVMIVGGEGFALSVGPLQMLCIATIPAVFACYVTNAILLPNNGERLLLKATAAGAITNLVANLVAIPAFGFMGAAFTTVLAEAVVLVYASYLARPFCDWGYVLRSLVRPLATALLCVVAMVLANAGIRQVTQFDIAGFFATGFALTGAAIAMVFVCRDSLALELVHKLGGRRS